MRASPPNPVPPEVPSREPHQVERDEKFRRFSRFYQGWLDFKSASPIEPPRAWSPYSRDLYYSGAEAAKRERDASS